MRRNRVLTAVVGGLSNQQIGLALTVYPLLGALSQPLFGWIADRLARHTLQLAAIGVAWMALCSTGIALAPNWTILLPWFMLATLGSGLVHPIRTASAAATVPDRLASATSIFFVGGQIG